MIAVLGLPLNAQNILSINNQSWGQNIGFLEWRPEQGSGTGIEVGNTFLSGWIWSQNFGWISLGDGTPDNLVEYSNASATDYGVNRDLAGNLTGHAWSPNMGWITFEQTHGMPRIDIETGAFSGHAWSQNFGWLTLGDLQIDVDLENARLAIANVFVNETSSSVTFVVQLDGPAPGTIQFDYTTESIEAQGDTATPGEDYTPVSGTAVQIAEGEQKFLIEVPILQDAAPELDESFTFRVFNVVGAETPSEDGTDIAVAVILDDPCAGLRNIFWTDQGEVNAEIGSIGGADLDGAQQAVLASTFIDQPSGVVATSEYLFILDEEGPFLRQLNRDGSNRVIRALLGSVGPGDLTVEGENIYWVMADGVLLSLPLDPAGGPSPTAVRSGLVQPRQIAIHNEQIYWTDAGGRIRRANLDGGQTEDLLTGRVGPFGIDVTSDGIYWSEAGTTTGSILRADLDGSNVETIVVGTLEPRGLVVADRYIYWVTVGDGPRIRRARVDQLNQFGEDWITTGLTDPWDLDVTTSAELSLTAGTDKNVPPVPAPDPIPPRGGTIDVQISPAGIGGQWRFASEVFWRNGSNEGGGTVPGITTGDYLVEFKPVRGYLTPEPFEVAASVDPGLSPIFTVGAAQRSYAVDPDVDPTAGRLRVRTTPDSIGVPTWRVQNLDVSYRPSNALLSSLPAGDYVVEFAEIPGRGQPASRAVVVESGQETRIEVAYPLAAGGGAGTTPLTFGAIDTERPYFHLGQVQTPRGFGTAFVVREKVALTAAHVIFDDIGYTWLPDTQFFPQRYRGAVDQHEPPPLVPRGYYHFTDYAAKRIEEGTPGEAGLASRNLDVAALFFVEDDWRLGYGGYLASGADENDWLTGSREKLLAGYPAAANGVPHTTGTTTAPFLRPDALIAPRVFGIDDALLEAVPGMSGGPVQVRFNPDDPDDFAGGDWYPAGIYLGGTGNSVVRAIDCDVIRLINRAATSANDGGNSTGGGLEYQNPFTEDNVSEGAVTVDLNIAPRGAWRFLGENDSNWKSPQRLALRDEGVYVIEFRSEVGFEKPAPVAAVVRSNQVNVLFATYFSTFASFQQFYFTEEERNDPDIGGPNGDPDGDGYDNLAEWAFNMSPRDSSLVGTASSGTPVPRLVEVGGSARLGIEFIRRRSGTSGGVIYTTEFGPDGQSWPDAGTDHQVDPIDENFERVIVVDNGPADPERFGRVRVTLSP